MIKFIVPGDPVGKQRPRKGKFGMYTPKKTVEYEAKIKAEYLRQVGCKKFPEGVPLELRVLAFFRIPKSTSKKKRALMIKGAIRPTKKPDYDNILKIVSDGLSKTAYPDDNSTVDGMCRKFYGEEPKIVVYLQEARLNE